MTTSLTNTLLSSLLAEYVMEKLGITDFDYVCEGDDNLLMFNDNVDVDVITSWYSALGFQTTIESYGGIDSEPTFCKIIFSQYKD